MHDCFDSGEDLLLVLAEREHFGGGRGISRIVVAAIHVHVVSVHVLLVAIVLLVVAVVIATVRPFALPVVPVMSRTRSAGVDLALPYLVEKLLISVELEVVGGFAEG